MIPLSGRYIPKATDTVVGTVTDVQGTFWLLDIGAPRWAPLHMTGTPWKIDFGETGQYLHVGDAVVVQVESIENTGRIGVTMNGDGLGKLEGGTIVTVSPAKVPRVIGRAGSMINTITQLTGCRLVVGQNGRIWLDGPEDGMIRARECLRLIDEEGHRSGLTERIHAYLAASADPAQPPPRPNHSPHGAPPDPSDRLSRNPRSSGPPHPPPLVPPEDTEPMDGGEDGSPGF